MLAKPIYFIAFLFFWLVLFTPALALQDDQRTSTAPSNESIDGQILDPMAPSASELSSQQSVGENSITIDAAFPEVEDIQWRFEGETEWRQAGETAIFDASELGASLEQTGIEGPQILNGARVIQFLTNGILSELVVQRQFDNTSRSYRESVSTTNPYEDYWGDTRPIIYFIDGIDPDASRCQAKITRIEILPDEPSDWDIHQSSSNNSGCTRPEPYLATEFSALWEGEVASYNYTNHWSGAVLSREARANAIQNVRTTILELVDLANESNRPLVIVGHSWGTVIAYNALMGLESELGSQNYSVPPIRAFITLGSPLGYAIQLETDRNDFENWASNFRNTSERSLGGYTPGLLIAAGSVGRFTQLHLPTQFSEQNWRPNNVQVWRNYYFSDTEFEIRDFVSSPNPRLPDSEGISSYADANIDLSRTFIGFLCEGRGLECVGPAHAAYSVNDLFGDRIQSDIRAILRREPVASGSAYTDVMMSNAASDEASTNQFVYPAPQLISFTIGSQSRRPTFNWMPVRSEPEPVLDSDGQLRWHGAYQAPRYWLTVSDTADAISESNLQNGSCPSCAISISIDGPQYTVGHPPVDAFGSERESLVSGETYFWRVVGFERSEPGVVAIGGEFSDIGQFEVPSSSADGISAENTISGNRFIVVRNGGSGVGTVEFPNLPTPRNCYFDHDGSILINSEAASSCTIAAPAGELISVGGTAGANSVFDGLSVDCGAPEAPLTPVPSCTIELNQNSVVTAHFRRTALSSPQIQSPVHTEDYHEYMGPLAWGEVDGANLYVVCVTTESSTFNNWNSETSATELPCVGTGGNPPAVFGYTSNTFHSPGVLSQFDASSDGRPRISTALLTGVRYYWRIAAVDTSTGIMAQSGTNWFNNTPVPTHNVEVTIAGTGQGEIIAGIDDAGCDISAGNCQFSVIDGAVAMLRAVPRQGGAFLSWQGCIEVIDQAICIVPSDGDSSLTATFEGPLVDNTAPRIASIERQSPTSEVTAADELTWRVTFDETVTYSPSGPASTFGLTNVDNVADTDDLALRYPYSVTTAVVGGTMYLFTAGFLDDGVSVFSVASDGTLTYVADVIDSGALELDGVGSVTTAVVSGTTYLFAAGQIDDGVSVFSVAENGTLTNVDNVSDTPSLELDSVVSIATAEVNGTTYLFTAADIDDGVSVFSIGNDGTLTNVFNVTDDATLELDRLRSVSTAVVSGTTYLFTAGFDDDGVSVFSVANDGTLTNVFNVTDDTTLELNGASSVTTAEVNGTTYLITAGYSDHGVSVFSVANNGALTNVDNVTDAGALKLVAASSVTTAVVNGTNYLFAAGQIDDGVSVFSVGNDGTLTNVANVTDSGALELNGAWSVTTAIVNGTTYLFTAGFEDDGVSVFAVTPEQGEVTNFTLAGTTATVTEATVSATQVDVTASGGDLANLTGTVTLGFGASQTFADVAGNTLVNTTPTGANDNTFIVNNNASSAAPRIASIVRQSPTSEVTDANQVVWRVTFDEAVKNVSADDFTRTGTTGTIAVVNDSATETVVILSGGDMATLNGTVTLGLAGGQNIEDIADNALTNTTPIGTNQNTFRLSNADNTAPRIASIVRQSPTSEVTATDQLTWRVTFDETVTYSLSAPASPFDLTNVDNVTDNSTLELDRISSITTAVVDGTTYLFTAASWAENGVSVFSVGDDGTLTNVFNITDDTTLEIEGAFSVTTAVVNGTTYLFVAGFDDDGISVFSVARNGSLINVDNVTDGGMLELNGPRSVTTATVNGTTYLFTAALVDNGVSVFSVANDGSLNNVFNVTDDVSLELAGSTSVTTSVVDGTTYLFVAGSNDDGVSVFSVADDGSLNNVFNVTDDATLELDGPVSVTTAVVGGTTYLFVAGFTDDGVSVFSVGNDGSLNNVDNVIDALTPELRGVWAVTTTVMNGTTYLFAAAANDDGVSVFSVATNGTLTNIFNVTDDDTLMLDGANSVTTADVNGTTYLFAAASSDDGVSVFAVTPGQNEVNNFSLAGSIATLAEATVSGTQVDVTALGGDLANLNGIVTLGLTASQTFADTAGNALVDTTPTGANEITYTLDNSVPTVTISSGEATSVEGPFTISIAFSETVSGFAADDLAVVNGSISNFAEVSGDNIALDAAGYTATVTPTGAIGDNITVDIPSGVAADRAGNPNSAAAQFSIERRGPNVTLTVARSGLGTGSVTSTPAGIDCGTDCNEEIALGSQMTLTAAPDTGSAFAGWTTGGCPDAQALSCQITVNADTIATARFTADTVPTGRIVAATLPGARSSYVGGPVMTVFMTVLSRASSPAQSCRITAPNDPPFTLSYQRLDGATPIGESNPLFDLGNGGAQSFVIAMAPTAVTAANGYVFLPSIACQNTNLVPIEGISSVQLSIGSAPVPDILSIGSTVSNDGVVRIPESGNRISFMAAAAVNIGAGDGSAGAGQTTVAASVDTGAASLPVTLEVCESGPTGCVTPRGQTEVTGIYDPNVAKTYTVFVRANGTETVPFSPANSRVFLRFRDAGGVLRSVTSAAISAPAPADQPVEAAELEGRWSVLIRQLNGEWPVLRRASVFITRDGMAIIDDGISLRVVTMELDELAQTATRFRIGNLFGAALNDRQILLSDALEAIPGAFWGVRDARSETVTSWNELAGPFGDDLFISNTGEIRGTVAGCAVYGQAQGEATQAVTLSLTGCSASGSYVGVTDLPANHNGAPALLIAGTNRGWRIQR